LKRFFPRVRTSLLAAITLSAGIAAALTAPPTAAASSHAAGPSCSTFMSTGTVEGLSGVSSKVLGVVKYPTADGIPDGFHNHVPGSICQWVRSTESNEGLNNTGQLLVGYGLTAKDWNQLVSYYKRGAEGGYPIGEPNNPTYSPLQLGHGSKAFLITAPLDFTGAAESPGFPSFLYAVTVMTRRHNLAQAWFYPGTAAKTQDWVVENILVKDAHFF
jgi:hypothetical protein